MTSNNGTSWGGTGSSSPLYKGYLSIAWAPEIGQLITMANDSNPITTYNNVSGWTSRASASIASLNWNSCAWSPQLNIIVAYSSNSNYINFNRNGNTLTKNGMLANTGPTQTFDRIKSNNTIYSKKLTSNTLTSYGSTLFGATTFANNSSVDSSGNWAFSGNTLCNNSSNYVMTRAYKGSNTASAGVVTFQLQQGLGGTTFSSNAVTYLVTMSLQSTGFAGGKAQGYTISSSNASLTSVSTGGLLTITVTQSTGSTYEFTQMQICY
jgi:hypothetical protein